MVAGRRQRAPPGEAEADEACRAVAGPRAACLTVGIRAAVVGWLEGDGYRSHAGYWNGHVEWGAVHTRDYYSRHQTHAKPGVRQAVMAFVDRYS